jgi:hypothetical protein
MVEEESEESKSNSSNNNKNNKRKRLLLKQQQQTSSKILSIPTTKSEYNNNTAIQAVQQLERMSYRSAGGGAKKNQHVKVLDNVKIHNYWSNIFRRKAVMHKYFSEAAFGSQTDTKLEYRELWKDQEYRKKYLSISDIDEDVSNELK